MADRSEILARVRRQAASGEQIPALLEALPSVTAEGVLPILRAYILDRYMLPPEEGESDELLALAEASLRRYVRLVREGAVEKDPSRQCSTASSVIVKKVLLMKAIQRDFGVCFTPAQSAELTTVSALAAEIAAQRGAGT